MVNAAPNDDLRARLCDKARELGFVEIGFAPGAIDEERESRLREWLDAGYHAGMEWMARDPAVRANPRAMWPQARSVIVVAMSYAPQSDPLALEGRADRARISVYARSRDYHLVMKKRLKALARWLVAEAPQTTLKLFVDTAPVMEKPLAALAGLGWQGKHTNLVSRRFGNWLFLGAIYTNLDFAPDRPQGDLCGSCKACQTACPTNAFVRPYVLDAGRCISYLTIEHKGPVDHALRPALGNRIYGCDDCLAVCPWNKFASAAQAHRAFLPRAELEAPRLADLLALDDAGFRALFSGSPIKRIGRNRFVRNCLYAAGNAASASLRNAVAALVSDPDPVVGEAAEWALGRIAKTQGEAPGASSGAPPGAAGKPGDQ